MPELPEAERARGALERALGRKIVAVEDGDSYVCRPHQPGEIAAALVGETFASAQRRGKFMWLETDEGPTLGLHLGMAGRIVIDPEDTSRWDRFGVRFDDAGALSSAISGGSAGPCSIPTTATSVPTPPMSAGLSSIE